MCDPDKRFNAKLIEDYYYNLRIRKLAESEGAAKTVKEINEKLKIIKLQLQSLEFLDD